MRKIFDGNYKKLDDDVSFQILRTNPRLTTNTKLLYDGESMYLESYDANELLSTQKYKGKHIWKSGLYNNDIKNFLQGTGGSAFAVGQKMSDTVVGNDYTYQFENMYWCGAEAITSNVYSQEFGIVAPLYLRKKLPNYFVVFKIEGPSNTNMNDNEYDTGVLDENYDFVEDILKRAKILKSFDLREGTVIGDYIRNYIEQSTFEYDKPMYVNFSTNEIYYYGIDLTSGLLTKKVENFKEELLWSDNTVLHDDDWFTEGYARNNLAFPYIINFEFIFDDNETDEYKFCRYFGFYCDDIDLYEFNSDSDVCQINENSLYYLKDKDDNLHNAVKFYAIKYSSDTLLRQYEYRNKYENVDSTFSGIDLQVELAKLKNNNVDAIFSGIDGERFINSIVDEVGFGFGRFLGEGYISMFRGVNESDFEDSLSGFYDKLFSNSQKKLDRPLYKNGRICISDKDVNEDDFTGYQKKTMSAYCNYVDGIGYATYTFSVDGKFSHGDSFKLILDNDNNKTIEIVASEYEGVYNNPTDNVIIPDLSSDYYDYVGICNEKPEMFSFCDVKYDKYGKMISPEITVNLCDFRYFNEETGAYEYKHNLPLFKIGDTRLVTWEYKKDDTGRYSLEPIEQVDDSFGYGMVFDNVKISQLSDYSRCEVSDSDIQYYPIINLNDNDTNTSYTIGGGIESIKLHKPNNEESDKLYRKVKNIDADYTIGNRFSCTGGVGDIARNICDCINKYHHPYNYFRAKSYNNIVVIRYAKTGSEYNNRLQIKFSDSIETYKKITKYNMSGDNYFSGGTDIDGCRFKVKTDDINYFIGEDGTHRYIRTLPGYDDAKVISYGYNIDEFGDIDGEYYTIVTDQNGKYIKISDIKQVEILDKFYPKFGVLSFFPVKDFDFDTLYSSYCDESLFVKELEKFSENVDLKQFYEGKELERILKYSNKTQNQLKKDLIFNNIKNGRLFNDNMTELQSEYDYFFENIIPQLCTVGKTTGHISKWGYVDGMDSCENPYRLNCNKIFGVDNLSANLFKYGGFKTNFTHDMPYYMYGEFMSYDVFMEEYAYINNDVNVGSENLYDYRMGTYVDNINSLIDKFKSEKINWFDKMFRLQYGVNKRHSKKYSKFKYGNEYQNANTLFRGVKFDICKLVNGKEIPTSIYNDYDFSFVCLPLENNSSLYFDDDIYVVKNDKFKFIVAFILCNFYSYKNTFNKSLMYAGCNNLIKQKYDRSDKDVIEVVHEYDYILEREVDKKIIVQFGFNETFHCNNVVGNVYYLDDITINSPVLKSIIDSIKKVENKCDIDKITITTNNNSTTYTKYSEFNGGEIILDGYKLKINGKYHDNFVILDENEKSNVKIEININSKNGVDKYESNNNVFSYLINEIYNMFRDLSAYSIKDKINNNYDVHYSSDDFKLRIIEPNTIETLDVFKGAPVSATQSNSGIVVSSAEIVPKSSINQMSIKRLNRYSGYYQPIFKDILFFKDLKNSGNYKFSNVGFDYEYTDREGSFGVINNMYFHKVNEDKGNTLFKTLEPYYPLTGEYAIDHCDYNIFASSWDMGYYTKQRDINTSERCNYIASVDNSLCMFGSKYMNVPEKIELEVFANCMPWDDNCILSNDYSDSEIMYREIDNSKVDYCLFIRKRLIRYFTKDIDNIKDEIAKYVKDKYSYGRKDTIDDDIEKFVEENLINLYRLNSIKMYVKTVKRGVHDLVIENDYEKYTDKPQSQLLKEGFVQNKSFRISNIGNNDLDRKITYDLKKGNQEYFAFKVYLIKK